MAEHARKLAAMHEVSLEAGPDGLLARLDENERALTACCQIFTDGCALSRKDESLLPAGEWLLDNVSLIGEQIRIARRHLPRRYSRTLPRLISGPEAGLPRVYLMALESIRHADGRLDGDLLRSFVRAYQEVTPLRLGELWAIPIMIRLALLENLRQAAERAASAWHDHSLAATWAARLLESAEHDRSSMLSVLAALSQAKMPFSSAFVSEFACRLQGQNNTLALPLAWFEERLAEHGLRVEEAIRKESRRQARDRVSISNSLAALRALDAVDWRRFVEDLSLVELVLQKDPAGVYPRMDFATRDHYRHQVERLARQEDRTEEEVARLALQLAQSEGETGSEESLDDRLLARRDDAIRLRSHIGYYLAGRGQEELEKQIRRQASREAERHPFAGSFGQSRRSWRKNLAQRLSAGLVRRRLARLARREGLSGKAPLALYLGSSLLLSLLLAWPLVALLADNGWTGLPMFAASLATVLTASELSLRLVNWLITLAVPPRFLPRLDFQFGIPATARTLVAVPALLTSANEVQDLLRQLERHFLANRDEYLAFGLLTDFADSDSEHEEGDEALLDSARSGIEALNRRYGDDTDPFFLCHRPRIWNPVEGCWMGRERKRGKLNDFNDLLRGEGQGAFSLVVGGCVQAPQDPPVRYVITLDADTSLPQDAARKMAGAMAHPLNWPLMDPLTRRVKAGYGILQPATSVDLTCAGQSLYARLFCCDAGIDPYTGQISDVYQDLFGEGSFVGKGIYDVDAFRWSMGGRFPDNHILSHDLIESAYARSGLVSDVQVQENFPARYSTDVSRRHRWIRGDWQILPWLFRRVPLPEDGSERNPLTALARWKILDNLRRSLVPAALLFALFCGWFGTASPWVWTLALCVWAFGPSLTAALRSLVLQPADVPPLRQAQAAVFSLARDAAREGLRLAWLPHTACFSLDAAARTLWRLLVSQRHLLEWKTASQAERCSASTFLQTLRFMRSTPLVGSLAALAAALGQHGGTALTLSALPLLALWIAAPALAWWVSRPAPSGTRPLNAENRRFLRTLARRTWAFLDSHCREDDHWLPPDNLQEAPRRTLAHRTSPTNMGLSLLAHLAAHDFGYLSTGRVLQRIDQILGVMLQLPRYRNHFYNWYDTRSLNPLPPRYISAVDSGNLAGHLMTLRSGLLALPDEPLLDERLERGLHDAMSLLCESLEGIAPDSPLALAWGELRGLFASMRLGPDTDLGEAGQAVERLVPALERLARLARQHGNHRDHGSQGSRGNGAGDLQQDQTADRKATREADEGSDVLFWAQALLEQCRDLAEDLASFALPLAVVATTPSLARPSLRQIVDLPAADGPATLKPEDRARLESVRALAARRVEQVQRLADWAEELANVDFQFLHDPARNLLAIGFNVDEGKRDPCFYDLLASEARLAVFVAIARHQIPAESWFALNRSLAASDGPATLFSWSGTMFEYLMPLLVMPDCEKSLLGQSCRGAVRRQIRYGRRQGTPWGISESCYYAFDGDLQYQYRAFGVPGLGLCPGLGKDLVIAPYASILALMLEPEEACRNLRRLSAEGALGRFGFYEAVDYSPSRLPAGQRRALVRAFMSHHQGMSLLALNAVLIDHPMRRRFMADPRLAASRLLLEERMPHAISAPPQAMQGYVEKRPRSDADLGPRILDVPENGSPSVQLLSNGRYHLMLSSAGGSSRRYGQIALTRWREDPTRDPYGFFCYLRDVDTGDFWSTTLQPTLRGEHRAIFSESQAEFHARCHEIETQSRITVCPENDVELCSLRLINRSKARRTLEITSYGEIVLAPPLDDAQHPAFSKLFVETECLPDERAILCSRRPRSPEETRIWFAHLLVPHGADLRDVSMECDRARFIGRGRSLACPAALAGQANSEEDRLSNSCGAVLDPVASIRCRIVLDPGRSAQVDFVNAVGKSREEVLQLLHAFRDPSRSKRLFDMAWTQSRVLLHQLGIDRREARLYDRMASALIFPDACLRAGPRLIAANARSLSALWAQSISGDRPIVLVKISDQSHIDLVVRMIRAHAWWRLRGLKADLVIWHEEAPGYRHQLDDLIRDLLPAGGESDTIFVRSSHQLSQEDGVLLQALAWLVVSDTQGSLEDQVLRRCAPPILPPKLENASDPVEQIPAAADDPASREPQGAMAEDGREYRIVLREGETTPAPWCNVLANAGFGTVLSESGNAYTWKENAHEFRLTPWMNDPVTDAGGEAFYLRDETSGHFWSPTALPRRGRGVYRVRHQFGASVFEHEEDGIASTLTVTVPGDAPVKVSLLRLRNTSNRPRSISVTGYVEWVLGDLRERWAMHIVTEQDPESGTLLARNAVSSDFPGRVAFLAVSQPETGDLPSERSFTCDRLEFIGRNRDLRDPAAMRRIRLSGRSGAALDPCAALRSGLDLESGGEACLVFMLGAADSRDEAIHLVQRFRHPSAARHALDCCRQDWRFLLDAVQVETPDQDVNALVNGWLMYQVIACRFRARSGFYQSGGAFGFRDQLQDAMSLILADRESVRKHLLLCAAHQFPEGDVLHWWHPPFDRGVRTAFSDDCLWLPLAVSRYVTMTGDLGVLDEQVNYIEGRPLAPGEESWYDLPLHSTCQESLYEHCVRAIERGTKRGAHGLPLMGGGDWNDGMNLVGAQGRGESVWLAFFRSRVLQDFAGTARAHGESAFAERCLREAAQLRQAVETNGWDGAWYRRAYFDDGSALGSAWNEECRIDSVSQSWAVLSGAASRERQRAALEAHDTHLVCRESGVIRLLQPPFDRAEPNPGYIRGYLPGVRENGGQYTHAAVWVAMAWAALGDGERAWDLFHLMNPLRHGGSARYRVEPYVVAADIYTLASQTGRGGWTWYTGAAGWMYRLLVESLLGLEITGDETRRESEKALPPATLRLRPLMPADWPGFTLHLRHGRSRYHIEVRRGIAPSDDRVYAAGEAVRLVDDGREERILISLDRSCPLSDDSPIPPEDARNRRRE